VHLDVVPDLQHAEPLQARAELVRHVQPLLLHAEVREGLQLPQREAPVAAGVEQVESAEVLEVQGGQGGGQAETHHL
jgi:hypothetical protein